MHLIQRGNNRQACFYTDADFQVYLTWLQEYAVATDCAIHAYVLMSNHTHILLTPAKESSPGALMKSLGQRYVRYINRTYRRSGTLWEGRFRSCIVQKEKYLILCQRYIELNPVRAGIVDHPAQYRWTSYRANAHGEKNGLIKANPSYLGLGETGEERQKAYRELFRNELSFKLVDEIRQATNGNFALGSERFKKELSQSLRRRVTPGKSGRPRKQK